jgi:hypothetical protein
MFFRALSFSLIAFARVALATAQQPPPRPPREMLDLLNRVQPDPGATYKIGPTNRIELRRGDGKLSFDEGNLAFFAPLDGKVTGIVFSGHGHILAAPRDPVEKQQLARFLGAPVLDQDFTTAYIRFTDDTDTELLRDLKTALVPAAANSAFADAWQATVAQRNPAHSFRIMSEIFSDAPHPYFAATLGSVSSGAFDFVYDQVRAEPQLLGQGRKTAAGEFYDIWVSYGLPGTSPPQAAFHALNYKIETTIRPDNSIAGEALVKIQASRSGERLLGFEFSSLLAMDSASTSGETLFTYPDGELSAEERAIRANGFLYVVLPQALRAGDTVELSLKYHGNVIRGAGNGVLFVGARDNWYPHLGDTAEYSDYDLTFHWPHKLRLAATGNKLEEHEEGETRTGHWHTEKPASVAGFNLGEYIIGSMAGNGYNIDVYANRQLEQALLDRLRSTNLDTMNVIPRVGGSHSERLSLPMPEPRPADALKQLAKDIDSSVRFYEIYSGPFPVHQLSVSQIPGTFGQGWPGLLYLSTYSFLPAEAQERAGLSTSSQEHFHDLVPFHEVAHQWWGNAVGWSSYHDQWIDEALATYLSLLFADSQRTPNHRLHVWLDRFRKRLVEKGANDAVPVEIGSLILGSRLSSSKDPEGFDQLVYGKGAWVVHMIREMLRDPAVKNPDARFIALLHTLQTKYGYRALSTDELQREIEAVMTPAMNIEGRHSMEWFFADWVRGTGIPHYRVEYSTKRTDRGYVVKGKLLQSGVAESFVAPVPIYSSNGGYLGRVIAGGPETHFNFVSAREPGKLQIDPQMTLLCLVDRN